MFRAGRQCHPRDPVRLRQRRNPRTACIHPPSCLVAPSRIGGRPGFLPWIRPSTGDRISSIQSVARAAAQESPQMKTAPTATALAIACATLLVGGAALASSHREAPAITKTPKVDNTDVYLFRSYEHNRSGYVTILANFEPFQDPGGGPNYFLLDDKALYTIHIDNDGDAIPDMSFDFHFTNHYKNLAVDAGGMNIPVPLSNIAPFSSNDDPGLNVQQSYTVRVIARARFRERQEPGHRHGRLHQAVRQHRDQVHPRLCQLCEQVHFVHRHPGLRRSGPRVRGAAQGRFCGQRRQDLRPDPSRSGRLAELRTATASTTRTSPRLPWNCRSPA